jgi:hypothetical protein
VLSKLAGEASAAVALLERAVEADRGCCVALDQLATCLAECECFACVPDRQRAMKKTTDVAEGKGWEGPCVRVGAAMMTQHANGRETSDCETETSGTNATFGPACSQAAHTLCSGVQRRMSNVP